MEQTNHQLAQRWTYAVELAVCALVAVIMGWWVATAHYLIFLASVCAVGFAFTVFADIHVAIFGLLFFSQILKIVGAVLPLPLGVNEFNIIFLSLAFVSLARYAITKQWEFRLREPRIGNYLYVFFALILISSVRAYHNFPNLDLVRSNLEIENPLTIITSQFVKPVMYMGLFFFGCNCTTEFKYRRRFLIAMGCCLVVYAVTMFLQLVGMFPIFSTQLGKQTGGILGDSNTLGVLLALYFTLFIVREPYFKRGVECLFPAVIAVVSIVGMVYARTRTSWAVAAGAWVLVALTSKRLVRGLLALALLAAVLLTSPLWVPQQVKDYFSVSTIEQGQDPNALLSGRINIWKAALRYSTSDWKLMLFGGGKFDFRSKGPELRLPMGFAAHHQIVQSLVDEGIIGVVVLLTLYGRIFLLLVRSWRKPESAEVRQLARLLTIITLMMVVSGTQIDDRIASWYWFLLGMFVMTKETAVAAGTVAAPASADRSDRGRALAARPAIAGSQSHA